MKTHKTRLRINAGIAALFAVVLAGCSGKTIVFNDPEFLPISDPICSAVTTLCDRFDVDYMCFYGDHDCKVSVTLEPVQYLAMTMKAIDNKTKDVIYERTLTAIDENTFNVRFKLYDAKDVVSEFTGVILEIPENPDEIRERFEESLKKNGWKGLSYNDCFMGTYYSRILSGDLKFYAKEDGAKVPSVTNAIQTSEDQAQVIITDYWKNGQKRLVREFEREDEEDPFSGYNTTAAYNYNEDGSSGHPLEVAALINDRWIGFTSNLVKSSSKEMLYLILRAEEGDWQHGKVLFCDSESACQSDYRFFQKGDYEIDSSNHIRLYNMKNSRGAYANECRFSIEGDSITNITFKGTYEDIANSIFVSDLDMKNKSWFKNSLISKYKMY